MSDAARHSTVGSLLIGATVTYARADGILRRALARATMAVGGALSRALTDDEIVRLSASLYDVSYAGRREPTVLFDWERSWFAARLPPAPARVLVGASGGGREARALAEAGYRVDAFEPSAGRARLCAARLPTDASVAVADFDRWASSVLEARPGDLGLADRYDAVLFGWGGLSHVLRPEQRARAFAAAHRICARGPILASFFLEGDGQRPVRVAERLGSAVGEAVAAARRIRPRRDPATFATWHGFTYGYRRAEIEALAATVSRATLWDHGDGHTPHATFVVGP